ncbi:hypothetical protein GCM10009854_40050 [Saccharopolyspora halophila]|uniref:Uncharacterized protein n=1 Tax=Saccharopolyspora halophila TaxID=405551 RepID=A0ABN3GPY7_9PSEU
MPDSGGAPGWRRRTAAKGVANRGARVAPRRSGWRNRPDVRRCDVLLESNVDDLPGVVVISGVALLKRAVSAAERLALGATVPES